MGEGWAEDVAEERRRALDERLNEWERAGHHNLSAVRGPFQADAEDGWTGGRLSGADVFYLAARALARELGDVESAAAWLVQREPYPHVTPQHFLSGLNLAGADLSGAQLRGARLIDAHLEGANLSGADLEDAILDGAHLGGLQPVTACAG
jgi:uncharacterized protein YjbI with pentapeptide repeats